MSSAQAEAANRQEPAQQLQFLTFLWLARGVFGVILRPGGHFRNPKDAIIQALCKAVPSKSLERTTKMSKIAVAGQFLVAGPRRPRSK